MQGAGIGVSPPVGGDGIPQLPAARGGAVCGPIAAIGVAFARPQTTIGHREKASQAARDGRSAGEAPLARGEGRFPLGRAGRGGASSSACFRVRPSECRRFRQRDRKSSLLCRGLHLPRPSTKLRGWWQGRAGAGGRSDARSVSWSGAERKRENVGIQYDIAIAGSHQDDVEFLLDGQRVRASASRAERRGCALAIGAGAGAPVDAIGRQTPLLPLDEVLSELRERRRAVVDACEAQQMMVSCWDPRHVPGEVGCGSAVLAVEQRTTG